MLRISPSLLVGFYFLLGSFVHAGQLDKILSSWRARQEKVRNADFEWSERHKERGIVDMNVAAGEEFELRDLDYVMEKHLVLSGSNVRYDFSGRRFHAGRWQVEIAASAYDGTSSVELRQPNRVHEYPIGFIYPSSKPPSTVSAMHTTPILVAVRPLDVKLKGVNPQEIVVLRKKGVIGNSKCAILKVGRTREFWVDAELDYSVVRINHMKGGKATRQYDIRYAIVGGIPVPSAWTISIESTGAIVESKVTRCAVNSQTITADDFRIEFPVGTVVTDMSNPGKGVEDYVIKADEPRRTITRLEASASYEQWMATPSGEAAALKKTRRTWLFLSSIVCLILGVWIWRKRLRSLSSV